MHWGLLPVVTESMRHNCSFVKGRFTGDPSYEYEHTETKKVENQDGDKVDGAEEENIVCKVLSFGCTKLPPFSLTNKTPTEMFPKFPSVLHVIDRSDRNPPIVATSVTF